MLTAVVLNCAIGVACLALAPDAMADGRVSPPAKAQPQRQTATVAPTAAGGARSSVAVAGALLIFMISGFCAMAYEVLWTKLLGLIVGPTTYSLLIYAFSDQFGLLSLTKGLVLFGFMVLPTFFLGATFPLVVKIHTRSLDQVGRSIGVAYTINTIGCVLGSFSAGFLLIPLVGKENGLRLVVALQLLTSLAVGAVVFYRHRTSMIRWAGLAAALVAGVGLCIAYPDWNRHVLSTGKYHRFDETAGGAEILQNTGWLRALISGARILSATERGELVYYGDGIGGFTTVLKYPGPFGEAEFSMANSGKMDASSRGDMKTQTLLAHFCPDRAHLCRGVSQQPAGVM